MLKIVRKNALLLALGVAAVLLFITMTRPAMERNRRLQTLERQKSREVLQLRLEAVRMKEQMRAIEEQDPSLLERAVRIVFQHGGELDPDDHSW